jgi:menaquinone-dependent protoporphyrinogen oxidase
MILVTYATKYGSTEEVAQAIAIAMHEAGVDVETLPMRDVRTLEGFNGVVFGTALYMGTLHRDARRFLSSHREALSILPVSLFALGPVNKVEKEFEGARQQVSKELAKYPWLTPVAVEVFGGRFDPQKMGFPFNLIPALRKIPASDARDWIAIRTWADQQAAALHPAPC